MLDWTLLFVALAGLLSSSIYLLLVLIAALRFVTPDAAPGDDRHVALPPVAVLKPRHGTEPLLKENLESFFRQQYPSFELIFGARKGSDPALQVVESLRQKYPGVKASIILTGEPAYPNAKVDALGKMLATASSPYLVITDSDVRVTPGFLKDVVGPLSPWDGESSMTPIPDGSAGFIRCGTCWDSSSGALAFSAPKLCGEASATSCGRAGK